MAKNQTKLPKKWPQIANNYWDHNQVIIILQDIMESDVASTWFCMPGNPNIPSCKGFKSIGGRIKKQNKTKSGPGAHFL